ncbi:MAG: AAA family ATPase [Bacteroidales bacterium]|nr:AAA family ATPase [Bacteroidales bacterium]MCF8337891.1 AAA family ATPase [Bacteroidales bacterium]
MNKNVKTKIVEAIKAQRQNYASNAKLAKSLGINPAQLSRIINKDDEQVLSDAKFISIARKLDVQITDKPEWQAARTKVFNFISSQLEACQNNSLSAVLADSADIGKTFTARQYTKSHKNCVYVDCSQVKSKQKLIRKVAKEFGLDYEGKYADVYDDLVFYIKSIDSPMVILDEAGDLAYDAFLEVKALWNATERACGWYLMGADGLKAKMQKKLANKKVGYAEMFSRLGNKFQQITPSGGEAREEFYKQMTAAIAKANGAKDVQQLYAKTGGSLRRIYIEIQKRKTQEK